jgi:hypothetical protein
MKTFKLIVEFFMNIFYFLFGKKVPIQTATSLSSQPMRIEALPELSPEQVRNFGGINPIFIPKRTKFKGYMRERHLGSRRSKYCFNKNK